MHKDELIAERQRSRQRLKNTEQTSCSLLFQDDSRAISVTQVMPEDEAVAEMAQQIKVEERASANRAASYVQTALQEVANVGVPKEQVVTAVLSPKGGASDVGERWADDVHVR